MPRSCRGAPGNTGILLLVSKGDRKVRIQLGGGWGVDADETLREFMSDLIVPQFTRGGAMPRGSPPGVAPLDAMARVRALAQRNIALRGDPVTLVPAAALPRRGSGLTLAPILGCFGIVLVVVIVGAALSRLGGGGGGWVVLGGLPGAGGLGRSGMGWGLGGFLGGMMMGNWMSRCSQGWGGGSSGGSGSGFGGFRPWRPFRGGFSGGGFRGGGFSGAVARRLGELVDGRQEWPARERGSSALWRRGSQEDRLGRL